MGDMGGERSHPNPGTGWLRIKNFNTIDKVRVTVEMTGGDTAPFSEGDLKWCPFSIF